MLVLQTFLSTGFSLTSVLPFLFGIAGSGFRGGRATPFRGLADADFVDTQKAFETVFLKLRKSITGAAAAASELAELRQATISQTDTKEATLKTMTRGLRLQAQGRVKILEASEQNGFEVGNQLEKAKQRLKKTQLIEKSVIQAFKQGMDVPQAVKLNQQLEVFQNFVSNPANKKKTTLFDNAKKSIKRIERRLGEK